MISQTQTWRGRKIRGILFSSVFSFLKHFSALLISSFTWRPRWPHSPKHTELLRLVVTLDADVGWSSSEVSQASPRADRIGELRDFLIRRKTHPLFEQKWRQTESHLRHETVQHESPAAWVACSEQLFPHSCFHLIKPVYCFNLNNDSGISNLVKSVFTQEFESRHIGALQFVFIKPHLPFLI